MRKLLGFLVILPFLIIVPAQATDPSTDCVIRDFQGSYTLNTDATLKISESLKVDCGNLTGKHGIFRILPTQALRPDGYYNQTKVDLTSITDQTGSPYTYETIKDPSNNTVTWKIGDPSVTIIGIHDYKIDYIVHNVTYDQDNKTVFNWNLNGTFWQLPIDHFVGTVTFPAEFQPSDTTAKLFDGVLDSKSNTYSKLDLLTNAGPVQYKVESIGSLPIGVGITLNSNLRTGVVFPYEPTFFDKYGAYLWFILPLLVLVLMWRLWAKKGKDPRLGLPEMVQYAPPRGLKPMEAGLLETNGASKNQFLTATIIDLAVRGYLKIEELPKAFLGAKDYRLTLLKTDTNLVNFEQTVLETLFGGLTVNSTTNISDQKNNFYAALPTINKQGAMKLGELKLIDESGSAWRIGMIVLGVAVIGLGIFIAGGLVLSGSTAVILSGIIILIFGFLMDRRTLDGAKAFWELKGFKLYMDKVESYRDKFYEQENIFEKYLPYAVAFGMTGKWIKVCKQLYADKNIVMPLPLWFIGGTGFSISNMDSAISSLSSQMGSSLASSPSSSGGGGFSGGGGGGGGGGSW
jgi:uncharacterized membrane protein YgcG